MQMWMLKGTALRRMVMSLLEQRLPMTVFNTEIKVNGQKLETVTRFKCLGSVIIDEGFKPEILS